MQTTPLPALRFNPAPAPHADGGTTRVLAAYATNAEGWGVVLTEWTTYRGNIVHEVLRYSPQLRRTTRLAIIEGGETAARAAANAWWSSERGLAPLPGLERVA